MLPHHEAVTTMAFSPNGRWLATGSLIGITRLWDLTIADPTRAPIVLYVHNTPIETIAFSSDSLRLAAGSTGGTVWLWDLRETNSVLGSEAIDPNNKLLELHGHENTVKALAISPNGRWLATGSKDRTVRLWDLTVSAEVRTTLWLPSGAAVFQMAFNPNDGRWLATGCTAFGTPGATFLTSSGEDGSGTSVHLTRPPSLSIWVFLMPWPSARTAAGWPPDIWKSDSGNSRALSHQ
jgi:WD40 repeat protein